MSNLLSFTALRAKLGDRSRSACYEDIKHGRLPKPIKIGRSVYWSETNIDLLIPKLQAKSDGDQIDTSKPAAADNKRQSAKK